MTVALREFPDVDEAEIASLATKYGTGSDDLRSSRTTVRGVGNSTSWQASNARPAWEDAISARASDLLIARDAFDHVSKVLDLAAREIETSRRQYDQAKWRALFIGDPSAGPPAEDLGELLDPTSREAPDPDPQQVRQYEAAVRRANQAAEDAEYVLAVCANELLGLSSTLTFPDVPSYGEADPQPHGSTFIFPIAPAFGAPQGAVFAGGVQPPQFRTGQQFEARVLRELGISGDRKSLFRPDNQGRYNLPRTASGALYRGVFPDSLRAGILEVKSGTTQIRADSPQIRTMRWVARTLGVRFNMVVDQNTPVERSLLQDIRRQGGTVLRRVAGAPPGTFYDEGTRRMVRAQGAQGARGENLGRTPLSAEQVRNLPQSTRDALNNLRSGTPGSGVPGPSTTPRSGTTPPTGARPSAPYVSPRTHGEAWRQVPRVPVPRGGFRFGGRGGFFGGFRLF